MRILFTCRPGYGHYYPLVPLARAAVAAGHAVAVAAGEPIRETAEADGFEAFGAGLSFLGCREAMAARIPDFSAIPPEQHRAVFFGQVFTDIELPARLPDLLAIADKWQPDVLVHDLSEFAGPLAAQLTGIPYATCGYGPLLEPDTADIAAAGAAPHWAAAGLDPSAGRLYRSLYLDPCPPSLQVPAIATVRHRVLVRPQQAEAAASAGSADWLDSLPARPTVHLSLGTIWNQDLSVFRTVLDALAARPVNVVVTLGPGRDPAVLGMQPANVHVRSFIPYAQLLDHCDLVVCHGGAGSVLGALTAGLPLLVMPQAADQFYNAARVVAAGAGRCLHRADLTAHAVGRAVEQLLDDPSYRDVARSIAAEIAAMPTAGYAVSAISSLV